MHEKHHPLKVLWSAIWLGIIGSVIFNLVPLFLATATEKYQLSNQQIGFLVGSEIGGMALASITTPFWLPRFNTSNSLYFGLLLIASGNLISIFSQNFDGLLIIRFLTGFLGSGVVYVIAIVTLGNRVDAIKCFGLLVLSTMLFSGIILSLLPFIILQLQLLHLLLFLCLLSLTGLLIVRFIPVHQSDQTVSAAITPHITFVSNKDLLALSGIFFIFFNLGSIWSFSERIGFSLDLDIQEIGTLLGLSMLPQAVGAIIPVLLGSRSDYMIPLLLALAGQITGLFILSEAENSYGYFWGISLWGCSLNLGIAYKMGLLSMLPNRNYLLALAPAIQFIAIGAGSSFCGLFISGNDCTPVILIAVISVFLSSILFMLLLRMHNSQANSLSETPEVQIN